jgi:hypothetical protein
MLGSVKAGVGNLVGAAASIVSGDEAPVPPSGSASKTSVVSQCSEVQFDIVSGKPIAGTTMNTRKRLKPMTPKAIVIDGNGMEETHVWGDCDASLFKMRVGPNYKKTGTKAPSASALYDIVGIDLYQSQNRILDIGSQVHIPEEWKNISTHHPKVPPVFIIVAQLPDVSDVMSGITNFFVDKSEGSGTTVVMYFRINPATAESLRNLDSCAPGIKLFAKFCDMAPGGNNYKDPDCPVSGRFKVCPLVDNIDDLGLPGFLSSYNAKPALVVQCAEVSRGDGYVCIETNVHAFGGIARSGLQLMSFDTMQMKWGFCIESRDDSEMPEVLFGTCFLDKPNMNAVVDWDHTLSVGASRMKSKDSE